MSEINTISCPTCHKGHDWKTSKPWSPFCCERCKLIDLGDWASEKHKIAGEKISNYQNEEADNDVLQ